MATTEEQKQQLVKGLTSILMQKDLLDPADIPALQQAFYEQDLRFEEFLIHEDIISKPDLLEALAVYYAVPALDVIGAFFDHHFLTLIPKSVLLRNMIIPYTREGDLLTVVAAQPDDPHLLPVLAEHVTHEISFMVGYGPDIREAINEFYDKPITYQPNQISNQRMERSMMEVHPTGQELIVEDHEDERIPHVYEETVDDYEGK